MAEYASIAELADYIEGWTPSADPAVDERLLQRAQRDVDSACGLWQREDNGLKFGSPKTTNEKGLSAAQVTALSRATCAQAKYRLHMGEEFFIEAQVPVQGPDYASTRAIPQIGPETHAELEGTGLKRLTSHIRAPHHRVPWYSFAFNVEDD